MTMERCGRSAAMDRECDRPGRRLVKSGSEADWLKCLEHLLGAPLSGEADGTKPTVGQALEALYRGAGDMTVDQLRTLLGAVGLSLVRRKHRPKSEALWLAVPSDGAATQALFEGTKWAGEVGYGLWAGALRQSPRGTIHDVAQVRINGDKQWCTLIRLGGLYDQDRGIISKGK